MSQINLITGSNATGKTNLVEAVMRFNGYNKNKSSLIRFGQARALVEIEVQKKESSAFYRLVAERQEGDSKIQKKQPFGQLPIIYFSPSNNGLFSSGPSERRHFMDSACVSLKKSYQKDFSEYQRIVRQKNRFLKDENNNKGLLESFNEQLVLKAERLIKERMGFLEEMGPPLETLHQKLTGKKRKIDATYKSRTNTSSIAESLFKQLGEREQLEAIRGFCLVGPHRDDLSFAVDGIDVSEYGSQGERKSACLAFKLAQMSLLKRKKIEPILVLDDALSELDINRRGLLMETIPDCKQAFLTATDAGGLEINKTINQIELL